MAVFATFGLVTPGTWSLDYSNWKMHKLVPALPEWRWFRPIVALKATVCFAHQVPFQPSVRASSQLAYHSPMST